MKAKQFAIWTAAGSAAFLIGFAVVGLAAMTADTLSQATAETTQENATAANESAIDAVVSGTSQNMPVPTVEEPVGETEYREIPNGMYAVDERTKITRVFRNIQYFSLNHYEFKDSDEGTVTVPIPPTGEMKVGKSRFKFTRVAVGKDTISFQTEEKNGVSYRFTGSVSNFDYCETDEELPDVVGRLIKLENKKWSAESEFGFSTQGCYCSH